MSTQNRMLRQGQRLFIRYQGYDLWRERYVLKAVGSTGSKYAILTPDFDFYIEDFSRDNPDIDALRLIAANGNVPPGVDPAETYRFRRMPNASELRNAMIEAQAEIDAELIRDGVFPETGVWISLETIGNVKRGDDVVLSANATILGSRAIDALTIEGNEVNYCCALVDADKKDEFRIALGVELEVDARTLPIKRQGDLRHRDFREGVLAMSFTRFDDWKVVGPRTAKWCLDFLVKRGGPLAHHEWWKSTARLSVVDVGVSEHETCMRIIETAVEYDQIDMLNVCSLEHVFRKAQLWEHYHRERVRKELTTTDKKDKAVIDVEEQQIFLGAHSSDSALMVSPELQEWVAKELEKLAQIDKQARKAREERALRK